VGIDHSPEHKAHIVASKAFYRKQTQHRSKAKAKELAKNRLQADKLASLSWLPLTFLEIVEPEIGMMHSARWKAEQYARSWTAKTGVQGGIKMTLDHEFLLVSCNTCTSFRMGFAYQPSTGLWALRQLVDHEPACFGAPTPADGATPGETARACKSAFTANQVARVVVSSMLAHSNMNMAAVRGASSSCFLRDPSVRFYVGVKRAALIAMATDRHVDMAALPLYAEALRELGHKVTPRVMWPRACPACSTSRLPLAQLS
jgi:hypothetical protein